MTKEDFLKRCETIYEMGLARSDVFKMAEDWCDAMMRLEGGQFHYFFEQLEKDSERAGRFMPGSTLAGDSLGYDAIKLLAVLTHHCQKCAEDKGAWHTRPGFCTHKDDELSKKITEDDESEASDSDA